MADGNVSEVKAFLKRALDLESILYSYQQTREYAQKTINGVSREAREVRRYSYGQLVPYEYGTTIQNKVYSQNGFFGTKYTSDYDRMGYKYKRFHSLQEYRQGYSAPNGYPFKNRPDAGRVPMSFGESMLEALILSPFIALAAAIAIVIFSDIRFWPALLWSEIIFMAGCAVMISLSKISKAFKKPDDSKKPKGPQEPTDQDYLEEKAKYEQILNERNRKLAKELGEESYCLSMLKEIAPIEEKVRQELQAHYEKEIVHPKYRNFVAIAQIYEYFDTGRCDSLAGTNGAYNLFESELRANVIIEHLGAISSRLEQIKQAQYMIYQEIKNANDLLGAISTDIRRVETAINVNTAAISSFNADVMNRLNWIG